MVWKKKNGDSCLIVCAQMKNVYTISFYWIILCINFCQLHIIWAFFFVLFFFFFGNFNCFLNFKLCLKTQFHNWQFNLRFLQTKKHVKHYSKVVHIYIYTHTRVMLYHLFISNCDMIFKITIGLKFNNNSFKLQLLFFLKKKIINFFSFIYLYI